MDASPMNYRALRRRLTRLRSRLTLLKGEQQSANKQRFSPKRPLLDRWL